MRKKRLQQRLQDECTKIALHKEENSVEPKRGSGVARTVGPIASLWMPVK